MLSNETPRSGILQGSSGGAFAFYSIDYPGGWRAVTLRLKFTPSDPVTSWGVGFNVYGAQGRHLGSGGAAAEPGVLELTQADSAPASWLVQVYNYLPGGSIAYTIIVEGLPYAPATPVYGTLTGSRAGAFALYHVDYPGDERVVALELSFSPDIPASAEGVGFNVYGPDGLLIGSSKPSETPGLRTLQHGSNKKERWLVQIYNYWPDWTISYSFVAKGLSQAPAAPPPAPPPLPGAQPETAVPVAQLMSGVLSGKSTGSFAYYKFTYPGDNSQVRVTMAFQPDNPGIGDGVGFIIYGPSGEVARGRYTDIPGERKASFSSAEAGNYLVQVFNYIQGVTISYSLS